MRPYLLLVSGHQSKAVSASIFAGHKCCPRYFGPGALARSTHSRLTTEPGVLGMEVTRGNGDLVHVLERPVI